MGGTGQDLDSSTDGFFGEGVKCIKMPKTSIAACLRCFECILAVLPFLLVLLQGAALFNDTW